MRSGVQVIFLIILICWFRKLRVFRTWANLNYIIKIFKLCILFIFWLLTLKVCSSIKSINLPLKKIQFYTYLSLKEINSEIIFLTKLFSYMLSNTKVFKNEWQILVTWYQRQSHYSHKYKIFYFSINNAFFKIYTVYDFCVWRSVR